MLMLLDSSWGLGLTTNATAENCLQFYLFIIIIIIIMKHPLAKEFTKDSYWGFPHWMCHGSIDYTTLVVWWLSKCLNVRKCFTRSQLLLLLLVLFITPSIALFWSESEDYYSTRDGDDDDEYLALLWSLTRLDFHCCNLI